MHEKVKNAILDSIHLRVIAEELQLERGVLDTGARSQVTSGKHLIPLSEVIISDVAGVGLSPDDIFNGASDTDIPGWFRASKKWDILFTHDGALIAAIELKSIFGSYGNNLNNRVEEAIGQSIDAQYVVKNNLLNSTIPPLFGYVMLVREEPKSLSKCKISESHFSVDEVFRDTSYIDRFRILCQRLRKEGLFSAVWFAVVNTESGVVYEPDPELSYEKFIAEIRGKVAVFLA